MTVVLVLALALFFALLAVADLLPFLAERAGGLVAPRA